MDFTRTVLGNRTKDKSPVAGLRDRNEESVTPEGCMEHGIGRCGCNGSVGKSVLQFMLELECAPRAARRRSGTSGMLHPDER